MQRIALHGATKFWPHTMCLRCQRLVSICWWCPVIKECGATSYPRNGQQKHKATTPAHALLNSKHHKHEFEFTSLQWQQCRLCPVNIEYLTCQSSQLRWYKYTRNAGTPYNEMCCVHEEWCCWNQEWCCDVETIYSHVYWTLQAKPMRHSHSWEGQ